jgi:NADPH:quinone reductase-like Zn-dependent oxidoreductase
MKAVRYHQYGGPEVLKFEDAPEPELRPDHVMVRVKACALNHLDLFLRKGVYTPSLPHINGSDVAGEVAAVGELITGVKVGERVLLAPMVFCGYCAACSAGRQNRCREFSVFGNRVNGGNAEFVTVPQVNVVPIPGSLSYEEAAAVPLVFLTAWHMLVDRCSVSPGQTVLVLGGNSGVGSAAIQIAKLWGARVIATGGDTRKLELASRLGADYTIDHYKQKISEEVEKITANEGVDIVFEHVGQATWSESMRSLKRGGTLVICGATSGMEAKFDIRLLYGKQYSLHGSYMGNMGDFHEVLKHFFAGRLKPVLDRVFPLHDARAAHERMEKSEQLGKIVLTP